MTTFKTKYDSAEDTIHSTSLNSLANGASPTLSEVDNTTDKFAEADVTVELALASAGTGLVALYVRRGNVTGKLATAELTNMEFLGNVQCAGTTTVRKSFCVTRLPAFWSVHPINNSGVALAASGNTIKFLGRHYENV